MNENIIECVFNYLNNDDFRYHMEDGMPYKELSIEERDILSAYIIELQEENSRYERKIEKLEHNWNELKEFLEIRLHKNCNLSFYGVVRIREELEKVINKMQELEGNDSK